MGQAYREAVEQTLDEIVRCESTAARFAAMAFRLERSSHEYHAAVARYQMASADRIEAQRALREAVLAYAEQLVQSGVSCASAADELRSAVARAAGVELLYEERSALAEDVVRWIGEVYGAAA